MSVFSHVCVKLDRDKKENETGKAGTKNIYLYMQPFGVLRCYVESSSERKAEN